MSRICSVPITVSFVLFQFVILVVDSTDRERLTLTKEELHRMLAHEVQIPKYEIASVCVCVLRDVY